MSLKEKIKNLDYPFGRSLAILSGVLASMSTGFAIIILKDEAGAIPPVFLYLLITLVITLASFLIKIQLYSPTRSSTKIYTEDAEESIKSFQRFLILAYALVLAIIAVVPFLAMWVPGLWWVISLTGFISGINISEIILYILSRKQR